MYKNVSWSDIQEHISYFDLIDIFALNIFFADMGFLTYFSLINMFKMLTYQPECRGPDRSTISLKNDFPEGSEPTELSFHSLL